MSLFTAPATVKVLDKIKLIIAGTRDFTDYDLLCQVMDDQQILSLGEVTVISGTAKGADQLGERWAIDNKLPLIRMPADWDKYGRRAGYIRNAEMAAKADHLLAFWDGESRGTKNMIQLAQTHVSFHVCVFNYKTGKYL